MTTAVQIANIGLKRILVQAADAPLEPDEYADFYTAMNNWMAQLEARKIVLGYTPVSAAADEITVPDGAIMGIAANVAILCAADYGGSVSASLIQEAKDGMKAIRRLARRLGQSVVYPNLPVGSGTNTFTTNTPNLYGEQYGALITLAANDKPTAIEAAATSYKVRALWNMQRWHGLAPDITGRITNTLEHEVRLAIEVDLEAFSPIGSTAVFGIVKNGDPTNDALSFTATLTATPSKHNFKGSIVLQQGEFLELWVSNLANDADITVRDARMALY